MKWLLVAAVLAVIVVAIVVGNRQPVTTIDVVFERTTAPNVTETVPTACHLNGALPDPACTPGVASPAVTQSNIASTICVARYTRTIRPPASYTDQLKLQQMRAYGLTGTTADYEEDHLIPLEVGGDRGIRAISGPSHGPVS